MDSSKESADIRETYNAVAFNTVFKQSLHSACEIRGRDTSSFLPKSTKKKARSDDNSAKTSASVTPVLGV